MRAQTETKKLGKLATVGSYKLEVMLANFTSNNFILKRLNLVYIKIQGITKNYIDIHISELLVYIVVNYNL